MTFSLIRMPIFCLGLASFNVGVEIGQLAIGLSVFLLFRALKRCYCALGEVGFLPRPLRFAQGSPSRNCFVWVSQHAPGIGRPGPGCESGFTLVAADRLWVDLSICGYRLAVKLSA